MVENGSKAVIDMAWWEEGDRLRRQRIDAPQEEVNRQTDRQIDR